MKKSWSKDTRLRDMNPTRALAYCANLTSSAWSKMESGDTIDLWTIFRAYILNGYKDTGQPVPPRVAEAWAWCKTVIDKEVAK